MAPMFLSHPNDMCHPILNCVISFPTVATASILVSALNLYTKFQQISNHLAIDNPPNIQSSHDIVGSFDEVEFFSSSMATTILMSQTSILHIAISPISKLTTTWSPEVFIHGFPWKVQIKKNVDEDEDEDEEQNSLAVYLYCTNEDDSSNWSVPACATVELMPFAQNKSPHVLHITPFVFRPSEISIGRPEFIEWSELMKDENQYVKNDSIQLKIEITAEDPNLVNRSTLKFEPIDKSCDCGSLATFRLTVTNIENLLAVCSVPFIVRGLAWNSTIYKEQTSKLGVMLDLVDQEALCKTKMSVKLLSSKGDVNPIKKCVENQVEQNGVLKIDDIISWEDLLKSENGFVENNSIALEVKLKADKPEGKVHPDVAAKRHRLECTICLKDIDDQDISSTTPCGHIFCTACIKKATEGRKVCPMCKKVVKTVHPVYLPISK